MCSTDPTEVGHIVQMEAGALGPPPVAPHWPEQPADEECKQDQFRTYLSAFCLLECGQSMKLDSHSWFLRSSYFTPCVGHVVGSWGLE